MKTLFIMTHCGSGWEDLAATLEKIPEVQVFETGNSYHHPQDVWRLTSEIHRRRTVKSVWADVLCENSQFTMKRLCKYYRFIFWAKPFVECCESIQQVMSYTESQAEIYWNFRLQGLNQYHARCPTSLWNPVLKQDLLLETLFG